MMSIQVVIERLKDLRSIILTFIIFLIFTFLGTWSGIYKLFGEGSVAIVVLLVLSLTLSALIVSSLSIALQFKERVREYSGSGKYFKVKKEKKAAEIGRAQEGSHSLSGDQAIRRQEELNKGEKFEKKEKDFLESYAYQYLFHQVRRMIRENEINIFRAKDKLGNLLVDGDEDHRTFDTKEEAGLNNLRIKLAKERFYFSEEEFKILVERELIRQAYEDFRKFMLSSNPQDLEDYVFAFLRFIKECESPEENYQELTQKLFSGYLDTYYLQKILEEQKIGYTKSELYDKIRDVSESLSELD
ncbi:MAG: hypothetical protein ACOC5L_00040 [Halobacteriota archaeon]